VLLTHHRKLDRWLQLGGHADGDGDLVAVARREAAEEAGVRDLTLAKVRDIVIFDVDIHPIPQSEAPGDHEHFDVRFAFIAEKQIDPQISHESHDVHWVALDRVRDYTDDLSVLRMRDKWRGYSRST
jgi:8-oxo-dGTP pyrophosphatase MutT (NUDIX family)